MSDRDAARRALRRSLAPQLARLGTSLELVVEDALGEEDASIDWVAAAPDGRAWVVLVEPATGGASLLEQALAQRAWVRARIPDWSQLAPRLGLRTDLVPRALLIARDFERTTRIAARELGEAGVLARWTGDERAAALESLAVPPPPRERAPLGAGRALSSVFRSGLTDADLAN
jgi:hypothetical protein